MLQDSERATMHTHAQIYGAVTLNNTLCLGVFLLIVHFKRLTWTYTSEVATLVGEQHCHIQASLVGLIDCFPEAEAGWKSAGVVLIQI